LFRQRFCVQFTGVCGHGYRIYSRELLVSLLGQKGWCRLVQGIPLHARGSERNHLKACRVQAPEGMHLKHYVRYLGHLTIYVCIYENNRWSAPSLSSFIFLQQAPNECTSSFKQSVSVGVLRPPGKRAKPPFLKSRVSSEAISLHVEL